MSNASNEKMSTLYAVLSEQEKSFIDKQTVHTAQKAQQNSDAAKIKFVLDSGATQHMVNDERYFDNLQGIDKIPISIAKKNECIVADQKCNISVKTLYKGDSFTKTMENMQFNVNSEFNQKGL